MEAMRESWTDERLDEFGKRIDERLDRVDERFDEVDRRFEQVDRRFVRVEDRLDGLGVQIGRIDARLDESFGRIDARLDSLGKAMVFSAVAFSSSVIAGFVAVATQL